jgi:hypothetical protein
MGSRNNLHNRAIRAGILRDIERALHFFYRGEGGRAKLLLKQANERFSEVSFARGSGWDEARDRYSEAWTLMRGPCACWYCILTAEQKQRVKEQVGRKVGDLSSVYADADNNFTGTFAEVVFGLRFGLEINQIPGFDGGRDFVIPCVRASSGELTIDVKGTTYGDLSGEIVTSSFPFQSNWKRRANHIYVLLHVTEMTHVFFRGFAFGNDKTRLQSYFVGASRRRWKAPMPSHSLQELEELITNAPGAPLLDKSDEEDGSNLRAETTRIVAVNPKQPSAEMAPAPRAPANAAAEIIPAVSFLKGMSVRHP